MRVTPELTPTARMNQLRSWAVNLGALVLGLAVTIVMAGIAVVVCRTGNGCENGLAGPVAVAPAWPLLTGLVIALFNRQRSDPYSWKLLVTRSFAPATIAPAILVGASIAWAAMLNLIAALTALLVAALIFSLCLALVAWLARTGAVLKDWVGWTILVGTATFGVALSLESAFWFTWWGSSLHVAILTLGPGLAGALLALVSHRVGDASRGGVREPGFWAPILLLALIIAMLLQAVVPLSVASPLVGG